MESGRHQDFAKHPSQDRAVHRDDTVTITGAEYLQTRRRLLEAERENNRLRRVVKKLLANA